MDRILARSCVFAKVGELVQGKLTPTEDFIIPGISSSKFYTKTFIYPTEEKEQLTFSDVAFYAVFIYLHLVDGKELDEITDESFSDLNEVKAFVYDRLKGITIVQHTNIPAGKGLSSGPTAILGVLLALNKFYSTQFDKEMLYKISARIVPTDPVLDKVVNLIFNPIRGERVFNLAPLAFGVVYFDSDSSANFDTKTIFSQFKYTSSDYVDFNTVLELYQNGSVMNDMSQVFKAITMSAEINQSALPKPKFDLLKQYALENEMGVFIGHTGSLMGLVMDSDRVAKEFEKISLFVKENWNSRAYYDSCEQSVVKIL